MDEEEVIQEEETGVEEVTEKVMETETVKKVVKPKTVKKDELKEVKEPEIRKGFVKFMYGQNSGYIGQTKVILEVVAKGLQARGKGLIIKN